MCKTKKRDFKLRVIDFVGSGVYAHQVAYLIMNLTGYPFNQCDQLAEIIVLGGKPIIKVGKYSDVVKLKRKFRKANVKVKIES